MNFRVVASLLLLTSLLPAVGCDKATPVAPSGTILTISANPSQVGVNGRSTITVVGRKPDGNPLNPGTEIRLTAARGTIDSIVTTDDNGRATATFRADGRAGEVMITAATGGGDTMAETIVQVGIAAGSVNLQATPSSISDSEIPEEGEEIRLLALVRDDQGQPLATALVNFTTEIGTLASGGSFKRTDSRGQATDTLTIEQEDITSFNAPTFEVGVQATGAGSEVSQDTFEIRIQRDEPVASFTCSVNGTTATFTNTSTGAPPINFEWDFDNDGESDSTVKDPVRNFNNAGTYIIRLVATNSAGSDSETRTLTINSTGGGSCG
jgi:hypothetical protein